MKVKVRELNSPDDCLKQTVMENKKELKLQMKIVRQLAGILIVIIHLINGKSTGCW